jgi:hypothetical protein
MMNDQQLKQKYLELGWDTFTDEGFVEIAGPFFFKKDLSCMHFLFETSPSIRILNFCRDAQRSCEHNPWQF